MAVASTNPNVPGNSPHIYEGSYKDIFTYVNFNFSVFFSSGSKYDVGRPKYLNHALFATFALRALTLSSSFYIIKAILLQGQGLTKFIGFNSANPPNNSAMRRFFTELELRDIQAVHTQFL